MLSLNLHRRHLSESQRAMVAARAKYEKAAKERMSEGGKAAGRGRAQQGKANLPYPIQGRQARDAAGAAVGVGGRAVDYGTKVLRAERTVSGYRSAGHLPGRCQTSTSPVGTPWRGRGAMGMENFPQGTARDQAGKAAVPESHSVRSAGLGVKGYKNIDQPHPNATAGTLRNGCCREGGRKLAEMLAALIPVLTTTSTATTSMLLGHHHHAADGHDQRGGVADLLNKRPLRTYYAPPPR